MEFSDLASVSGKSGLFKVVKPTRSGAILETLDGTGKKFVVGMSSKLSLMSDISIYTTDDDGSVPLKEVLQKIHKEFSGDTGLSSGSEPDELKSFLKFILPNYDESRVYVSDIKKLINWYHQIAELDEKLFADKEEVKDDEKKQTQKEATPKKKKADEVKGADKEKKPAAKKPAAKKPATKKKATPKKSEE